MIQLMFVFLFYQNPSDYLRSLFISRLARQRKNSIPYLLVVRDAFYVASYFLIPGFPSLNSKFAILAIIVVK